LKLTPIAQLNFGPTASVVWQTPAYDPFLFLQRQGGINLAIDPFAIAEAKNDIQQLGRLSFNWDGFGAIPIRELTQDNAIAAVNAFLLWTPSPLISPNPNGTISMEWETDAGTAQLEVGQSRYSVFIDPKYGEPILRDGSADQIAFDLGFMVAALLFPPAPGTSARTTIESDVQAPGRRLTR
jgi:hypothetical protein